MRTTGKLVGTFVGILGLSGIAAASPNLQFQTVIDSNDAIAGDFFGGSGQVVVSASGTVGIVGLLENTGDSIVIYSTPQSGNTWSNQTVAVAGTLYNIPSMPPAENFDFFDNLAITSNPSLNGTRLTFDAQDGSGNAGIIQWDGSSLEDVAFDGDSKGYSSVGGNGTSSSGSLLEMQVNGTGQAMFPALISSQSPPNNSAIVRGDNSAFPSPHYVTPIFTSSASITNINDTGSRVALGDDNSGAALLRSSGTPGIYILPANPGAPVPIPLGNFTPSTKADPIIGYASNVSGASATLMLVNGTSNGLSTGTPNGSQEIVLSKNGGTPQPILPAFTQPTLHEATEGQMTPDGQIAVYVPSTSPTGDTIQHANAASGNPAASVIASVYSGSGPVPNTALALDPTGSNLDIIALTSPGSTDGPEINSNGTILFDAEVGTSPSNEKDALLDWLPGDQSPEILLAAGDTVDIDGNPEVIDDYNLNSLSNDYDYYKNALNDQNQIAVSVEYGGDTEAAVLFANITAVPEPSTIALVSIASVSLLARRRRR